MSWLLVIVFLLVYLISVNSKAKTEGQSFTIKTSLCKLSSCEVKEEFEGDIDALRSSVENIVTFQQRMEKMMINMAVLEENMDKLLKKVDGRPHHRREDDRITSEFESYKNELEKELKERFENIERMLFEGKAKSEAIESELQELKQHFKSSAATDERGRMVVVDEPHQWNETQDELKGDLVMYIENITKTATENRQTLESHELKLATQETKMAETEVELERLHNATVDQDRKLEKVAEWITTNMTEHQRSVSEYINAALAETNNRTKRMILQEDNFRTEITQLQNAISTLNSTLVALQEEKANASSNSNINGQIEALNSMLENLKNSKVVVQSTPSSLPATTLISQSCYYSATKHPDLTVYADGEEIKSSTVFSEGSKLTYKCKGDKLKLKGSPSSICKNGRWTSVEPICLKNSDKTAKYGTKENPCPQKNGNFRDLEDCTVFYQCADGVMHGKTVCPGVLFFNQDKNQCLNEKPRDCI